MSRNWLVRVPEIPAADAVWEWIDASDAGAVVASGDLAALADAVRVPVGGRPQPVIALLPATAMLVVPVNAPLRQQRQLQQALPFLLEESLAADIERFHVVAGTRLDPVRLQAVAVEHALLRRLLDVLQSAGIDPPVVSGEALLLPRAARDTTCLLDGADSVLVAADGSVLPFDEADSALVASRLASRAGGGVRVSLGISGSPVSATSIETALSDDDGAVPVVVAEGRHHRLQLCADALRGGDAAPANLRQGPYAPAGGQAFSPGFDWRPLAWLAASWAVLALGYQVALGITHGRAADAVREAQVALYRQAFPGSGNVLQPRAQMEGQLRTASGRDATFSALVARTAETMVEMDAGGRFTPRNLAWDGAHRQLRIDIVARSLDDLEQLRQALEKKGLVVDIGSGVSQDGGYKARMNVGEGA